MEWINLLSPVRLHQSGHAVPDFWRSEFERDVDRIIFSHPFRRLQDKTQVVPLPEHDFVHTRLTHSLEVSSVGRSMGKKAGSVLLERYPVLRSAGISAHDIGSVVAAACLAHDIGNPPFGHSGEQAISSVFRSEWKRQTESECSEAERTDLQNFEGNAQGLRLLAGKGNDGLRLTAATLGAFLKYPRESVLSGDHSGRRSRKKYGFFQSEKPIAQKLANICGIPSFSDGHVCFGRHPLVYLTEAADDICYLIIDLEDAVRMRVVSENEYVDLLSPILGDSFQPEKYRKTPLLNDRIGLLRALTINRLADSCASYFLDKEAEYLQCGEDVSISDCIVEAPLLRQISQFSSARIYNSEQVLEIQAAGFRVLPALTDIFLHAAEDARIHGGKPQEPANRNNWEYIKRRFELSEPGVSFYENARLTADVVSGLTDRHAISLFRKLTGSSL
jgi:dGTPase